MRSRGDFKSIFRNIYKLDGNDGYYIDDTTGYTKKEIEQYVADKIATMDAYFAQHHKYPPREVMQRVADDFVARMRAKHPPVQMEFDLGDVALEQKPNGELTLSHKTSKQERALKVKEKKAKRAILQTEQWAKENGIKGKVVAEVDGELAEKMTKPSWLNEEEGAAKSDGERQHETGQAFRPLKGDVALGVFRATFAQRVLDGDRSNEPLARVADKILSLGLSKRELYLFGCEFAKRAKSATPARRERELGDEYERRLNEAYEPIVDALVAEVKGGLAEKYSIVAYNGGSKEVREYLREMRGKGTGAAVFGEGVYLALRSPMAREYATMSAPLIVNNNSAFGAARKVSKAFWRSLGDLENGESKRACDIIANVLADEFERSGADIDWGRVKYNIFEKARSVDVGKAMRQLSDSFIDYAKKQNYEVSQAPRYLHTVEIPDDTGTNYLDWDKPVQNEIFEQANRILDGILDAKSKQSGRAFYEELKTASAFSDKSNVSDPTNSTELATWASDFLHSIGVVGMKHKHWGEDCVVIYDEADTHVKSVEKFSLTEKQGSGIQGSRQETRDKETMARDAEYLAAVESGDLETAQEMVNEEAARKGYTFHRGKNPKDSPYIVEFADDPESITSYGEHQFAVKGERLMDVDEFVDSNPEVEKFWEDYALANGLETVRFVSENNPLVAEAEEKGWETDYCYGGVDVHIPPNAQELKDGMSPSDIVNSAGLWDDSSFVSALWSRFEFDFLDIIEKKGIAGFKTPDGAVVFPGTETYKIADAVTRDDSGNVIPLSQRFNDGVKDIRYSTSAKRSREELAKEVEKLAKPVATVKPYVKAGTGYVNYRKEFRCCKN